MPTYTDVMIDLETLGTKSNAAISQIGACAFDYSTNVSTSIHVDAQSCIDLGMSVDWKTVQWWLTQDEQARTTMSANALRWDLPIALSNLNAWIQSWCPDGVKRVWAHGPTFDISIISDAYARCKRTPPWHYRAVRDTRTLMDIVANLGHDPEYEKAECAHDAESDAIAQAKWVQRCHNRFLDTLVTELDKSHGLTERDTDWANG